ncbi:MAG: hypothetical protein HY755_09770 [Nitrospirae bacterium]|nr:hypothetical protein [Nitrospirota bacterium]
MFLLLKRFDRLWRVHFFIDRKEKERIRNWRDLLITAIDKLVLDRIGDGENKDDIVKRLASNMTTTQESPWHGCTVIDDVALAAYQKQGRGVYPFGARSIRNYIKDKTDAPET